MAPLFKSMIKEIKFSIQIFRNDSKAELYRSRKDFLLLMEALSNINLSFFRTYPKTPLLYNSKIIYKKEVGENWQDVPTLLRVGFGDCEDLACYRIGELNAMGISAKPYIEWRKQNGMIIHHALVLWPDGRVEDPSLALGMRGHPITRSPIFIDRV